MGDVPTLEMLDQREVEVIFPDAWRPPEALAELVDALLDTALQR